MNEVWISLPSLKKIVRTTMKKILLFLLFSQMIVGCASMKALYNENLFTYITEGNINGVQDVLVNGADVNAKDSFGNPVLIHALAKGNTDIIKILLDNGANVNNKDPFRRDALIYASSKGNIENIKILMSKGVKVSSKNIALLNTSFDGNTDIAKLLLENGADINTKNHDGVSPLMGASWNGHTELIKFLIKNGADINAKDHAGVTSLMVASWNKYKDVEKILIENGAKVIFHDADSIKLRLLSYRIMIDILKKQDKGRCVVPVEPIILTDIERSEDVPAEQFKKILKIHPNLCNLSDVCENNGNTGVWYKKSNQEKAWILRVEIKKSSCCWRTYLYECFLLGQAFENTIRSGGITYDQQKGKFVIEEDEYTL